MGKKRGKTKSRSPREESSEDPMDVKCVHIRKGLEQSWLRKMGPDQNWNFCQGCEQVKKQSESQPGEDGVEAQIWTCLKCGHRGCGRYDHKHAIEHYEKAHSEPHCLVLSLENWSVWCYICDNTIQYSSTGQLAQLICNIKRQVPEGPVNRSSKGLKEEDNPIRNVVEESAPPKIPEQKEEPKEIKKKSLATNGLELCAGSIPVRGLSNLGNTCFFNAVVQNLSQTRLLRQLLCEVRDQESSMIITPPMPSELDPLQVQLARPGPLTLAMCQLLNEIQEAKKNVVTPRDLFTQVCKKASRFKGFQQQDSQELLRYLLDGLRTEETSVSGLMVPSLCRLIRGTLQKLQKGKEAVGAACMLEGRVTAGISKALRDSGESSEALQKKLLKGYESSVERVFRGEMTSTVMCKECKTVSVVTESFLDLSLPVADETYKKKKGSPQRSKETVDAGRRPETPDVTEGEDVLLLTGAGSKYQQKKAKKQAKKQSKSQRRQQKLDTKLTLDSLTTDPDEPVSADMVDELGSQSEPAEINNHTPAEDEEEVEEREDGQSPTSNPFNSLSEERVDDEKDESEEAALSQRVRGLSLSSEEKLIDGTESETETKVEERAELKIEPETDSRLGEESEAESIRQEESEAESIQQAQPEFVIVNQDPKVAFSSLASRAALSSSVCSVESSLYHFTQVEELSHPNSLLCLTCSKRDGGKKKIYREALKQMLISSPPPVLTLHLKRFQQVAYSVCKVNRHVQFPQVLDLAPFCSVLCKGLQQEQTRVLYSLYGVVEHSGTMRSGHYTAFVKSRLHRSDVDLCEADEVAPSKGCWFHISDSSVTPVSESRVQNSQAYLLFYERISKKSSEQLQKIS